ncbi:tannase/feruloyl esterase family alpha/beta hydrolase [Loktanella agnita]|uniref:tannase/feruloyl esterase family alpha/beta hydrolase n=1 Tax=Loktanella agnita TaxID=287097 RepID=UPI003987CE3D
MQKRLQKTALLVVMGAGFVTGSGAVAQEDPAAQCDAMRDIVFDSGHVTSARVMDAAAEAPAYCEIRATALPAIGIEVRLPLENWNGGYYQAGCGGFCGNLHGRGDLINSMVPGLVKGYATATSDSGHHGLSSVDAGWADGNPHAERDWGWRSIGETNRVAMVMIDAFYDSATSPAIFQGCSTGGRMAHMAALRYPDMFDGIISGAPALNETALVGTALAWQVQANTGPDGTPILKADKTDLIGDEVMRQCDDADGTKDGLIADPRACTVDLSVIGCEAGNADAQCLTPQEIEVVAKWRNPPVDSTGKVLAAAGIPAGSEPFWRTWLTGDGAGAPAINPLFGQAFGSYMAFPEDPGPSYSLLDFDFDRDPGRMAAAADMFNADDVDISAFRDAGGKMIVWHGWADAIVPPSMTTDWHARAEDAAGGAEALAQDVALYMIPGMDHCGLAAGPGGIARADIDPLTALENWLENGTAPDSIMVTDESEMR